MSDSIIPKNENLDLNTVYSGNLCMHTFVCIYKSLNVLLSFTELEVHLGAKVSMDTTWKVEYNDLTERSRTMMFVSYIKIHFPQVLRGFKQDKNILGHVVQMFL